MRPAARAQREAEHYEQKYQTLCTSEQELVTKLANLKQVTEENRDMVGYLRGEVVRLAGVLEDTRTDDEAVAVAQSHVQRMSMQLEDHLSMEMLIVLETQPDPVKKQSCYTYVSVFESAASLLASVSLIFLLICGG
jgi:hypothetical protein